MVNYSTNINNTNYHVEGHDGSKDDPPLAFDNSKFEQAIKLLPKVYDKLKDDLRYVCI
jgi:hypothetical protein